MAESPLAPSGRFHARSISLPSRSHPVAFRVEKELLKVRSYINTTHATPEMMQDALRELAAVYESIEEVLCLPSNQAAVASSSEKRWQEMELDESVRLLDLCCTLTDSLIMKEEHIKDLKLALRKRDRAYMESKAITFIRATKNINKDIKSQFRLLKCVDNKSLNVNSDLQEIAKFLIELKATTISLLQLVSSFLVAQTESQTSSRWLVISKALGKKKEECKVRHEGSGCNISGFFSNYVSILRKDVDEERAQKVQNQMQSLEICMEGLHNGLQSLFRQMIRSRVAILNILSS